MEHLHPSPTVDFLKRYSSSSQKNLNTSEDYSDMEVQDEALSSQDDNELRNLPNLTESKLTLFFLKR